MASVQALDPEMIPELRAKKEIIADAFKPIVGVFEASIELARKNNIAALERECISGMEAAQNLTKIADELDQSLDKLITYLQNLEDAMA